MKITKAKLKQIIKEELEVTLTNEEAGDMFGEHVEAQLEENDLNEGWDALVQNMTPENLSILFQALAKIAANFSPAIFGTIAIMAARRAMGLDDPYEIEQVVQQTAEEYGEPEQPALRDIPWAPKNR